MDGDCEGAGGPDDDEDGDGSSWTEESAMGSDDCAEDSDGDGYTDVEEFDEGRDPADATSFPGSDAERPGDTSDPDNDKGCSISPVFLASDTPIIGSEKARKSFIPSV